MSSFIPVATIASGCLTIGVYLHAHNSSWTWKFYLFVFLAEYLAATILHFLTYATLWSPLRNLPGPKDNHLFFGQLLHLARAETPTTLPLRWMKQYPTAPFIRYLTFANAEVLVVNSPTAYKEVLQSRCYSFTKPDPWRRMVEDVTGRGILMLEFDEHRVHRKFLNGAFTPKDIRRLGNVFMTKAHDIVSLFDRAIGAGTDGKTGIIDCTQTFSKGTLDIMFSAIFGIDPGYVNNTNFGSRASSHHAYTFHEAYEDILGQGTVGRLLTLANGFFPTRWIPCEANRKFLFAAAWLNDTLYKLVRQRRAEMLKAKEYETYLENGDSILSFILEAGMDDRALASMTDEYIVGHLLILLVAGHDTSAIALCWCVYELARRRDIQTKLRREMKLFEQDIPDPTCSDLDGLPYLHNFVRECLRVYPPAIVAPRQAAIDITIEGTKIPKGTILDVLPALICMNPLIWGDDAADFRPERWDHLTEEQSSPYVYQVFSCGPRVCIGKQFALHEIKAVLFAIVRRYEFLGVDGDFAFENPALTLRPSGLRVRLRSLNSE